MNTYYIDGYRIAAHSTAAARYSARELAAANAPREYEPKSCYQCDREVPHLFSDSRCWSCTDGRDFE